ncbi:DUF2750 domain-containing protein [Granulosicoccus antarcticus]|uniref:DUF2750 domain-containing protein n=1 Tax=Granulosicoccus antarcticus IMCC3135 TaxID=1192854 RepID=A0A2Z2P1S3_9GAMM|nr:DUF2750 domain-containing protein [Granulosicoccus antarcticus]ASJ76188.1 hypothetical protein IMCC3135_30695 [Granulosicoccus antarcticus IMCC3135]
MYTIDEQEYESVVALESNDRFKYFIGKVAEWQQLWGVKNDEGWLVPEAPEGFEYFPLWPHPKYAQDIADNNFQGYTATEISLDELLEYWLPLFKDDSVRVAIFPDHNWTFWCIEPEELAEVLEAEISNHE